VNKESAAGLVVFLVAGARPNFMKIAPIYRESRQHAGVACRLIHTGQHYDYEMSQAFFQDLELPEPAVFLKAGSGSHAAQTARIMIAFEKACLADLPGLVIVVGDVNSTLACSLVAKKLLIRVAHVEAGLRSFDRTMPEEINRIVTDAVADDFFVTEESGLENLRREGQPEERIHFVGNVMIDNLFFQLERLRQEREAHFPSFDLKSRLGSYLFLTLHRPSNVDRTETFQEIAAALNEAAERFPILFPMHPRTRKMAKQHGIRLSERVHVLPPLGFRESLYLWKDAEAVLTDSGGLQEETTALGVPCVTLRENTERPVTLSLGTNILAGNRKSSILEALDRALHADRSRFQVPPRWDGQAARRIWEVLLDEGPKDGRSVGPG